MSWAECLIFLRCDFLYDTHSHIVFLRLFSFCAEQSSVSHENTQNLWDAWVLNVTSFCWIRAFGGKARRDFHGKLNFDTYLILSESHEEDDGDEEQNDSQSHQNERKIRHQIHDQQELLNPRGRHVIDQHRLHIKQHMMRDILLKQHVIKHSLINHLSSGNKLVFA